MGEGGWRRGTQIGLWDLRGAVALGGGGDVRRGGRTDLILTLVFHTWISQSSATMTALIEQLPSSGFMVEQLINIKTEEHDQALPKFSSLKGGAFTPYHEAVHRGWSFIDCIQPDPLEPTVYKDEYHGYTQSPEHTLIPTDASVDLY